MVDIEAYRLISFFFHSTEKIYGTVGTTTTDYVLFDFKDGGSCRVSKKQL